MFDFFKKKKNEKSFTEEDKNDAWSDIAVTTGVGITASESAKVSTIKAKQTFAKPDKYDRSLLDNDAVKRNTKVDAFKDSVKIRDPYTGKELTLTKAEARIKYGDDWMSHLAEADHIVPLEKRHEQTKKNPWLKSEDVKKSSNSAENVEVVSRKYNNAKRKRTTKEFIEDEEYLKKTGVELSDSAKKKALKKDKQANRFLRKTDFKDSVKNMAETGHDAGIEAGKESGTMGVTISAFNNIFQFIKGEKSLEEALADTAKDGGKSALTGYATGNIVTVIQHTLSNSSSKFLQGLVESNVPGKVITAVMVTGDTLKKYLNGEITTQDCLLELGEKGIGMFTTSYAMMAGQTIIPIPVVGAAVGAFVGSLITGKLCGSLMDTLKTKDLEHQERLQIIAECERMVEEERAYRAELENYLERYLKEYKDCFDEALVDIKIAFKTDDPDGVIAGANKITKKLGGRVNYETVEECRKFLLNDETDVL